MNLLLQRDVQITFLFVQNVFECKCSHKMTKLQIFQTESRRESLNVIKFSLQSRHMPLRQQVHGGDSLTDSRKLLQQYVVGGSPSWGRLAEKRKECRKTCSLDNPSDMLGTRL